MILFDWSYTFSFPSELLLVVPLAIAGVVMIYGAHYRYVHRSKKVTWRMMMFWGFGLLGMAAYAGLLIPWPHMHHDQLIAFSCVAGAAALGLLVDHFVHPPRRY
jgi:cell division protein FtsW (lipid II flippase)